MNFLLLFFFFFLVFQTFEIFSGDNAAAVSSGNVKRSQDFFFFFFNAIFRLQFYVLILNSAERQQIHMETGSANIHQYLYITNTCSGETAYLLLEFKR